MIDFNHTINVLIKAYFNGTLRHGKCAYCAVGTIVHASGAPPSPNGVIHKYDCSCWKWLFYTDPDTRTQIFDYTKNRIHKQIALDTIKPTGYQVDELARIEFAFETAPEGDNADEYMFNGLMAVVDVLAEIHGIDLTAREETKKLFVKSCD